MKKIFVEQLKKEIDESIEECEGIFFRGYRSLFWTGDRFEERQGLRLLKKKSCSGCEKCGWFYDGVSDCIECGNLVYPEEIKNGGLYSVDITTFIRIGKLGLLMIGI